MAHLICIKYMRRNEEYIMNKWQKVGLAAGMGTAVIATTHIINKFIFKYATINNYTFENKSENSYGWKFGNIAYSAYGDKNASPLLLIHDLNAYSSGYEWNNVIQHLSDTHYVYVLDMLGCGHSDKPHITYTTYMYTQLLNDFITNVIGKPTDIMATGSSAPIAIGAAFTNNALYNKIEKIYKQEFERMSEFQNVFQKLQLNVLDVFNEFPFEFNYKESIGIQEYLKLLGIKISNNKEKIIDTIFSLIDVVEYLSIAKLLIFVNIKLYLGNDEIQEVYKYAMYKKVNILLIETGEEKEPLENEKILYIDSDYDEIILYNK